MLRLSAAGRPRLRYFRRRFDEYGHGKFVFFDDFQFFADEFFDIGKVFLLVEIAKRHRGAALTRAPRTADPVHVGLGNVRKFEIDDGGQILDVDASRRDIGGDEHADLSPFETVERVLPRALRFVAVNGERLDLCGFEFAA